MQKELAAAANGELHDEKHARKEWDNFLVKLFRKVEIEGGRSKLDEIRKQQQEEETIYTDEFCGRCMYITRVSARMGVHLSVK